MKEIGEFLKQKRLEKGITIEDLVNKTRMPITRIKAIEEGDISLFKDDITYLQFFIQSYCRALGVDYAEIKEKLNDSILGYTTTFQTDQIRAQEETEKNIRERSNQRIKDYKVKYPTNKVKRRIDFSLISFVAVISIILVCLIVAGTSFLKGLSNEPDNKPNTPPVVQTPVDDDKTDESDNKPTLDQPDEPVVKKEIEVNTTNDVSRFTIVNAEEKFVLKVQFVANSWFELKLDGIAQATPKAAVYDAGNVLEIEIDPTKQTEISMRFGYFANNKVFVADKEIAFDSAIATKPGVQVITLVLGGESNELAE